MDVKKIALSLCALGLSSVASAGGFMSAPECSNQPVSVPCEHSGWDFGLTGYWGRLTSEHMVMDVLQTSGNTAVRQVYVRPDYRFGFGIEGSYHWGHGNDLVLDWTHFDRTYEDREIATSTSLNGVSVGDLTVNRARFKFDTLSLELGQKIDVGSTWDLRAHAGLHYLRVQRDLDFLFATPSNFAEGDINDAISDSRYSGVGPRIGFDSAYHLNQSWSLIGQGAASILAGRLRGQAGAQIFDNFDLATNNLVDIGSSHAMVGGLDGRVGVQYDYPMTSGLVSVVAGYAGAIYFNPTVTIPFLTSGSTFLENLTGNFGMGSVFLNAKYTN